MNSEPLVIRGIEFPEGAVVLPQAGHALAQALPNGTVILEGFTATVDAKRHNDEDETVILTVLHLNVNPAEVRVYKVTQDGQATLIDRANLGGKDADGSTVTFRRGLKRTFVAEATPGGAGSTMRIVAYDKEGVLGPEIDQASGGNPGGDTGGGDSSAEVAELRQALNDALGRITAAEQRAAAAETAAKAALDRANYVKSVFDPVWGRLDSLDARPVGISRDEAWKLAGDRVFAETAAKLDGLRQDVTRLDSTSLKAEDVLRIAKQAISEWFEASRRYVDRALLNLMWDRAVKLLRYKESTGKTAAQLPVNDQTNLEV
jgi:hypothetical protein